MGYQVLARKWRPRTFGEMVGQEHVLRALVNGLDNDRLHHAYLFSGTRGVGKTTLARILAKCLNCETGISATPCNQCSACTEIAEGRFVDLIEVDAASRTKVEDTRELLENVQYAPTRGRYKVYLIDEVHMLSGHSFNALLKTLEEPPPHVKFLLATTDPQKLPVTVLSRCLQFNLKNLNPERIQEYLQHVLEEEKIPYEEAALWQLARAADGSMRDALSLTDQAIAHGGGTLTAAEVNTMLGTIDHSAVIDICRAVAVGDGHAAMAEVDRLAEHAPDYHAALAELLSLWHRIAIAQTVPDALDPAQEHRGDILELAATLAREDVQLYYQITLLGRRDLPWAADPRSGFEMVLLRLLAFRPELPDEAAAAGGEVRPPRAKKPEPARPAPTGAGSASGTLHNMSDAGGEEIPPSRPKAAPAPARAVEPTPLADSVLGHPGGEAESSTGPSVELDSAPSESRPEPPSTQPAPAAEPPSGGAAVPADYEAYAAVAAPREEREGAAPAEQPDHDPLTFLPEPEGGPPESVTEAGSGDPRPVIRLENLRPEDWRHICDSLGQGGLLQNIALNSVFTGVEDDTLHFDLDEHNSALYEEAHEARLGAVLTDYFGRPVRVRIRIAAVEGETPRMISERERAQRRQEALENLREDPHVRNLCRVFGAELIESSVRATEVNDG